MKRFIKQLLFIFFPFLIVAVALQFFDFFKVYRSYDNYFKNNRTTLNRTVVATRTFLKYRDSIPYNTFVFGNSRAQAFKDTCLVKYFGKETKPFHFDSDSESLYGVYKKLEFLSLNNANLTNVVLVLDASILNITSKRNSHNYVNPPEFKDVTSVKFYSEFIKASCNAKFISAIIDYNIFKTKRRYLKKYILTAKNIDTYNPYTLGCNYGNEVELKKDSVLYYKNLMSKIRTRISYKKEAITLTKMHTELLHKIYAILKKHKSRYNVIISPLYDQVPLNNKWKSILNKTFKEQHVFDFSGKNKFTEPISNYYEWSHYKPFVAEQLLDSIHKKRALN